MNRISEHVYWLAPDDATDRPTLGAVVGRQATLMIDAGNSPAHARLFLDELAKLGIAPPDYLVLTHWHWDHVFGTSVFDIPVFASTETQRLVAEMAQLDWSDEALERRVAEGSEIEFCRDMIKAELPDRSDLRLTPPNIAFTTQIEFNLGRVRCQVKHVGGDHAPDSSIVIIPEDKIAFLSDCLSEDLYHHPPRYTRQNLYPLLDEILRCNADHYLLGHDSEPLPKRELIELADLLRLIGDQVAEVGHHRDVILQALPENLNRPLDDDDREIIDAFLAGLGSSEGAS